MIKCSTLTLLPRITKQQLTFSAAANNSLVIRVSDKKCQSVSLRKLFFTVLPASLLMKLCTEIYTGKVIFLDDLDNFPKNHLSLHRHMVRQPVMVDGTVRHFSARA